MIIPTSNRAHLVDRAIQSFRGHEAEVYIEPATIMFKQEQGAGQNELGEQAKSIMKFSRDNFNWNRVCGNLHEIIFKKLNLYSIR